MKTEKEKIKQKGEIIPSTPSEKIRSEVWGEIPFEYVNKIDRYFLRVVVDKIIYNAIHKTFESKGFKDADIEMDKLQKEHIEELKDARHQAHKEFRKWLVEWQKKNHYDIPLIMGDFDKKFGVD